MYTANIGHILDIFSMFEIKQKARQRNPVAL